MRGSTWPEPGTQDEIRAVFDQLLEAQNAGDAEGVRSRLSDRPDAIHIGTDAEEWWTSKQIVDALAGAGGVDEIQAVADDVDIHVQGDVAWAEGADGSPQRVAVNGRSG